MRLLLFQAILKGKIVKNVQKWVSLKTPLKIHCFAHTYSIDCTQSQIPKSSPANRRRNFDFILIGSKVTGQNRWRVPNLLWTIALCHLTRCKKCDDIWLPCAESFPAIYNMNDFAAISFNCYYTLSNWLRLRWLMLRWLVIANLVLMDV